MVKQIKFITMKAIFIVFNQANTERVEYMLDRIGIREFTWGG
jgi:hypothetical protein